MSEITALEAENQILHAMFRGLLRDYNIVCSLMNHAHGEVVLETIKETETMPERKAHSITVSFWGDGRHQEASVLFYSKKGTRGHTVRTPLSSRGISWPSVRRAQRLQLKMAGVSEFYP